MSVKVSVGIPVYNAAQYIENCARSIFSQTLVELEIVFVDDCSTDNSIEILQKILMDFPERQKFVKIIRHTENQGPLAARKSALKHFTGEYFIFCDSDDTIDPQMYENMYKKAVKTKADIVHCGLTLVHVDGEVKKGVDIVDTTDYKNFVDLIFDTTIDPYFCNHMFKRSVINIENFYLPDFLFFTEDLLFVAQALRLCQSVACCPEGYYTYVRRASSICHSSKKRNMRHFYHVISYLLKTETSPHLYKLLKTYYLNFFYRALRYKIWTNHNLKILSSKFSVMDVLTCRNMKLKKKIRIICFILKSKIFF